MKANYTSEELGRLFLCLNNKYQPEKLPPKFSVTEPGLFIQYMRNAIRSYNVKSRSLKSEIKEKKLMSDHDIKQAYLDPGKEYEGIDKCISEILDNFGVTVGLKVIANTVEAYMGVSSDYVRLNKPSRKRKKQFTKHLNPAFEEFKSHLDEIIEEELSESI